MVLLIAFVGRYYHHRNPPNSVSTTATPEEKIIRDKRTNKRSQRVDVEETKKKALKEARTITTYNTRNTDQPTKFLLSTTISGGGTTI